MNRFHGSHWQDEAPVLISLAVSICLLAVAAVTVWLWQGGGLAAG